MARGLGVLAAFCALLVSGCAPAPAHPVEGNRTPPKPHWERFGAARTWPVAAPAQASRGHGVDGVLVEVHVSPEVLEPYRGLLPGAVLPAGAAVAAFHRTPGGASGSVYAMTKLPSGEWEFIAAEPDGTLLARGPLAPCAGCHDDAPADHLFGVFRPPVPPASPGN